MRARKSLAALLGLSAASGGLLFLADYPVHLWPLQWVALIPLLLAIERGSGFRAAALAGAVTGLAYMVPLRIAFALPFPLGDAQAAYFASTWVLMALGFRWACHWSGASGPFGMAAVAVVVEWANVTLVPVWGAAQSFSRVCSASPRLVQAAGLAGFSAVVFLLVATQALAVRVTIRAGDRRRPAFALLALIGAISLYSWRTWRDSPRGYVRVAAIGWASKDTLGAERATLGRLRSLVEPLLEQAATTAPRLIVTPEAGLALAPDERAPTFERLAELARHHRVTLAVGYFDIGRDTNLLRIISPDGNLAGEYTKTHLVPFYERYQPGDGTPLVVRLPGDMVVGSMICHDDNFPDLGRAYGRAGVDLVVTPTRDWREAKDYHFESSILRAVENRYAVVRAASDGISAVVSAKGEVLARMDHWLEGAGVVAAELPLVRSGTPYSSFGDWLPVSAAVFLMVAAARELLRRRIRGH